MDTLKIVLKSLDADMVQCWEESFSGFAQVCSSEGDILKEEADAIVSPANSFGYMDGGIDLVYSQFFGWDLEKRLRKKLLDEHYGELPVGQAVVIETKYPRFKYLVSAPTMRVPMNIEKTANVYLAFRAVLHAIKVFNQTAKEPIQSVACPALGTGEGRVSYARCAEQMLYAYLVVVLGHREDKGGLANAVRNHIQLVE